MKYIYIFSFNQMIDAQPLDITSRPGSWDPEDSQLDDVQKEKGNEMKRKERFSKR